MLSPLPREAERRELMDGLDAPAAELTQSLSDIARLNRIGGTQTMQRCVAPFLAWRALVVACPRFYPGLSAEARDRMLTLADRVLDAPRFDPDSAGALFP